MYVGFGVPDSDVALWTKKQECWSYFALRPLREKGFPGPP